MAQGEWAFVGVARAREFQLVAHSEESAMARAGRIALPALCLSRRSPFRSRRRESLHSAWFVTVMRRPVVHVLVLVVTALGFALVFGGVELDAQGMRASQLESPAFEVASIRPNNSGGVNLVGIRTLPSGSVVVENLPLRSLIVFAYGLDPLHERIEGRSDLLDQHFDVIAKAGSDVPRARPFEVGPVNLMMQNLLAERFGLVVRVEHELVSGYVLVTARPEGALGPGIQESVECGGDAASRPSASGDRLGCRTVIVNNELRGDGVEMGDFARTLAGMLRRPIVDRTGIEGSFEVRMSFDQGGTRRLAGLPASVPDGTVSEFPSLFAALQEQLGLKLEPERVPVRVVVVEHVEPPSPN
jgi:uncharacterized protein (TIGR03435 family)